MRDVRLSKFRIGLVTAPALFFGLSGVAHAAVGGPVCNVPTDYSTIQAAVNDTGCSTIRVAAGTYNESVTINRSLTLRGAKAGNDARTRNANNESVINKLDDNTANITINADNVTVDGFSFNGPASGGTAALVMQNGNSGEHVQNNIINNPGRAASITTSNSTFRRNLVSNSPTTVSGFQGNSTPVTGNVVRDNTFTGNASSIDADINFIEGSGNETVTGNKSNDGGTLLALFKTNGATVTNNIVSGGTKASSAIYLGGGDSNITVRNNNVSGASTAVNVANDFGIGVNSNITVNGNTLSNNSNGVKVGASAVAANNTVTARRNLISGNTTDGFNNLSTFNQSATCNWWGAANGPGPVGAGSGDGVSTNVAFSPWLSSKWDFDCDSHASGNLKLSGPSQRIIFSVANKPDITQKQGNVEYWNYDYPGGLHYKANILCSYVDPQTKETRFMFQIPSGFPGLSGLYVVAYAKEVNHGTDLYGHTATGDLATATNWCENGVGFAPQMYTVTQGNVHVEN